MIWLFLAAFLDRAQLQIAAFSYESPFNGLGATDLVNARNAKAPMAYRVLVPWIIAALERLNPRLHYYRTTVYEGLKVVTLAVALWACNRALGLTGALLVAAMLPMTFAFDYWCWPVELAAFALALTGNMQLTLLGGIALALSRETAPLIPLTYLLATGNWNGALIIALGTGLTLLGVRLYVGKRPLYCDRFMWRRNLAELKEFTFSHHPLFMDYSLFAVLITVLVVGVVVTGRAGAAWPIPLIILALGWTMGVARETRIFAPVLLWIAIGVK